MQNASNMNSAEKSLEPGTDAVSTLGTTSRETVYRGLKGSFHRQQKKPRAESRVDWESKFVEIVCDGDDAEAVRVKAMFFLKNGNKRTIDEANGMLAVFIEKGAKEDMLRSVLGVGQIE